MAPKRHRNGSVYVIYKGRVDTPTIYDSWSQVHPRVTGYGDADHESCESIEQARKKMQSKGIAHFEEVIDGKIDGEKPVSRKPKYYAVAGGRRTEVFTNWHDAEAATKNTDACHQSFATREGAERFITVWKDAYADTWRRQIRIALDSGWTPKDMNMEIGLLSRDCDGLPNMENLSIKDAL